MPLRGDGAPRGWRPARGDVGSLPQDPQDRLGLHQHRGAHRARVERVGHAPQPKGRALHRVVRRRRLCPPRRPNHILRSRAAPRELQDATTATSRHTHPLHGTHLRRGLLARAAIQRRDHILRHDSRVLRSVRHLQLLHLLHGVPARVLQPRAGTDHRTETTGETHMANKRISGVSTHGRAVP